jgi:hypothetical protein
VTAVTWALVCGAAWVLWGLLDAFVAPIFEPVAKCIVRLAAALVQRSMRDRYIADHLPHIEASPRFRKIPEALWIALRVASSRAALEALKRVQPTPEATLEPYFAPSDATLLEALRQVDGTRFYSYDGHTVATGSGHTLMADGIPVAPMDLVRLIRRHEMPYIVIIKDTE